MVATTTIAMAMSSLKVKGSMARTSAQQKYSRMLNGAKETRQRKEESETRVTWINATTKKTKLALRESLVNLVNASGVLFLRDFNRVSGVYPGTGAACNIEHVGEAGIFEQAGRST